MPKPTEQPAFREPVDGEYPFEVLLLTGDPLHTRKLGDFIIDLSTLTWHRDRLTVDYNHEEDKILGFGQGFRTTPDGLIAGGRLISGDFVDRLVELARHGTPFEASPTIAEQDGEAEILGPGETAVVNGREVSGPMTIFRNVPLRGFAICPHGTDKYTKFTVLKKELDNMPKKDVHEKRNMMKIVPDTTKLADEEAADSSTAHPDLEELIEIFGQDYGLKLYREGVDIEEARKYKELKDKFDIPTPEAETTELNEEEEKVVEETVVEKKEEEETTGLKSVLTKLSSKIDGLTAEVTKLKKIVPRGETAAVSHGLDPAPEPESPKPASNLQRMAAKYKGA